MINRIGGEQGRLSGGRLLFPCVLMFFVFAFVELVEYFSPFAGYGDAGNYYLMMAIYLLSGLPLMLPFLLIRYDFEFSDRHVQFASRYGWIFLALGFVGISSILFDRILIQGVDYSQGISAARENWRELSTSRSGVSSPFSVLGSIFYPNVFSSIILTLVFYERLTSRLFRLLAGLVVVILFSLIIGGRTSILVLAAVVVAALVMRRVIGLTVAPRGFIKYGLLGLFVCVSFAGLIFYWRMVNSPVDFSSYAASLVGRHGGYVKPGRELVDVDIFDALMYSIVVYVVHVKWVFQSILADQFNLFGNAFLNQIMWILSTRGGVDLTVIGYDYNWTHSGNWISLAGALWHDFRGIGVLLGSFCVYSLFSLIFIVLIKSRRLGDRLKVWWVLAGVVLIAVFIFSPFVFLLDVVEFTYLILGLCLMLVFLFVRRLMTVGKMG